MALHGVDVSKWQADWVPATNDTFVGIKSTEGHTYTDPLARRHLDLARARSMQVIHYHFLWPGQPEEQAAYFVQQTDIRPGDLLALDFEDTKGGHPSAADAEAFKAEVKRLEPGFRVGTYCDVWDWKNTAIKAGDFLWIAAPGVSKPDISATWAFWQYSKTDDAGEAIDQNRAQFDSLDSLKAWANGARYSIDYQSLYVGWKGTSEWV